MRPFFQPVPAPPWLGPLLMSVRAALSDIWPTAIRLKDYATADLPLRLNNQAQRIASLETRLMAAGL